MGRLLVWIFYLEIVNVLLTGFRQWVSQCNDLVRGLILVVIRSAEPSWLHLRLEKGGIGTYPWYCIQLTHERVELWVEAGGRKSW